MRKPLKSRVLASVLCLSVLMTGCYGTFNATRQMHHWNGSVTDSKWAKEGLYLVTGIVYAVFFMGDALIFNSIEFWGGENPISDPGDSSGDD